MEGELPPPIDYDGVYRSTADAVYRICLAVLRDVDDAADATMDVFRKLLINPPTRHVDNLEGWVRTSARTTAIDHLRRLRPLQPIDGALAVTDRAAGPEELVIDEEAARRLRGYFAQLTLDQRRVVELRTLGCSSKEIADVLNRNVPWVNTTYRRALLRLRELMTADDAERGGPS